MPPRLDPDVFAIRPKRLPARHYLTEDLVASSKKFNLAGQLIDLKVESVDVVGAATALKLSPQQIRKLNRRENLVEAAVAPIKDEDAMRQVRGTLKRLRVPTADDDRSVFYAMNLRRRLPGELVGRDLGRLPRSVRNDLGSLLALQHKTANREDLILQFTTAGGKLRVVLAGKFGAFSTYVSELTGEADPDVEDEDEREVEDHPAEDSGRELGQCYSGCLEETPPAILTIAGALCGACVTVSTAGLIPGTQPATIPMMIAACSACAVALGLVLGGCLLACHETSDE